jgi:hypothetical protein
MKALVAVALAALVSVAGLTTSAVADDRPGVWRQPADPWNTWGHGSGPSHDGRRDGDRWDRDHWRRGHWYGPPHVIVPPHRPRPFWVPGGWVWSGATWVWIPGHWRAW